MQGNWIGADLGGVWPLGNGRDGICLQGSSATTIGGVSPGAANTIQFNNGAGVNIFAGQSNRVSANSIFDNGGPGILLGSGANQSQNAPVLTDAVAAYGSTQVQGVLSSQANTSFWLEFFASPAWDGAGIAEGRTYLGAATRITDPAGNANFSVTLPGSVPADHLITATATDPAGNTSPFSPGIPITAGPAGVALSVTRSSNGQITVSWPSAAAGFELEAAAFLEWPIQWYPVTNGISDDGILKTFIIPAGSQTNQFFRLKR